MDAQSYPLHVINTLLMAGHLSSTLGFAQQEKQGAGKVVTYWDESSKLIATDRLGSQGQILLPNGLLQSRRERVMEHVMDKRIVLVSIC